MGYDLRGIKNRNEHITMGAFSWPFILRETGAGYVLGYGQGLSAGQYVYLSGNNGSPVSNDGYRVSITEAKAMVMCCKGYVHVQEFINKQWTDMSENGISGRESYRQAVSDKFLDSIKKFIEFAEKSGGFTIR